MKLNRTSLFLIDGIGAGMSAVSLGLLLPSFQEWIGLPNDTLHLLAAIAVVFALYSLTQWRLNFPSRRWLQFIASLNLAYCQLTALLVVQNWPTIQPLGVAYFGLEILVVAGLATIELKVARTD